MSTVLNKSRLSVTLLLAVAFTFAACSKSGDTATGPAATAARAYFEALTRKDAMGAKKYLSAASIKKLEAEAKDLGKTLDVAYKESVDKAGAVTVPSISNEKISGDTATVDIQGQGKTLTMPMVKEGGEWKLAIDKAFPNQRIFESPAPNSSPASPPASSPDQTPSPSEDKEEEEGSNDEHDGHEEK